MPDVMGGREGRISEVNHFVVPVISNLCSSRLSVELQWTAIPAQIYWSLEQGPGKLLYMAVHDIGDLRAQNQPQVCPNFGDFRVQGQKICPKVVHFGGFETDLGCFGPGPWTQII